MSITFNIEGERSDLETGANYVNLADPNARELLAYVGLPQAKEIYGSIESSELAARCRRRLWPEARNEDPGREGSEHGCVIDCGRRAGYLPEKATALLKLCELAKGRKIVWG